MNLAENLRRTATVRPDGLAVKMDADEVTYGELADGAARVATYLKDLGVQPGDRVALMLPNAPVYAVIYYGILWAGGVVVPTNPLYKAREIGYALNDSDATVIFAWDALGDEVGKVSAETGTTFVPVGLAGIEDVTGSLEAAPLVERDLEDTAVVLYTSGTTGSPKGAELSHANVRRNAEATVNLFTLTAEDVVFGGLPLFHAFGQGVGMNTAVAVGAAMTLMPRFEPSAALQVMQRDGVTVLLAVPTMYAALLQCADRENYDVSTLRLGASGGASLPVEVLNGFEKAFDVPVLEGYGLSETSPVASFNHADRPRKVGSVGQPIEGIEFRLIDGDWNDSAEGEIGEIAIRGHNIMKGYLGKPEATATVLRDGWFRTGDLARRDEDGYYFIVDRSKDMIIRGGFNVYPREVEEVLYEHPAIATAAVVGVPHPTHGEEVAAAITLKDGHSVTEDEVREYVRERVAPYKYPRIVWITGALPLGATGKILKREISIPGHPRTS